MFKHSCSRRIHWYVCGNSLCLWEVQSIVQLGFKRDGQTVSQCRTDKTNWNLDWYFVGFWQSCTTMLINSSWSIIIYHYCSNHYWLSLTHKSRQSHGNQSLVSQSFPSAETTVSTRHGRRCNKVNFVALCMWCEFFCFCTILVFANSETEKPKLYVVGHVLYFVAILQRYSRNVNNFIVITLWLYSHIITTTVSHSCTFIALSYWLYVGDFKVQLL